MPVQTNFRLFRDASLADTADMVPVGNPNLSLDDIQAGYDFRDRVLDLDAWIDLDEIELVGIDIHKELNRARANVVGSSANAESGGTERIPCFRFDVGKRDFPRTLTPAVLMDCPSIGRYRAVQAVAALWKLKGSRSVISASPAR